MLPSIAQLTAAAALLGLASASPTKSGFTVHQVVNRPGVKMSGPYQMAKTFAKFGKPVPDHVAAAAAISTGTVAANPEQFDSEYLEAVAIGRPAQTLNLDFDTGSSDLWVFSSELSSADQGGHSLYDPSKSSTSKVLSGASWKIQYGDGSGASGNVYTDTVAVGKSVVTGQAVELAQTISSQFTQDTNNDGLLGLAFDAINTVTPTQQKTFFSNAKSQLPSPVFTANLKKGAPGTYDFGFIDASKHTGTITYVNVQTNNGFWEFTGNGYAVGSGAFTSSSIDGIADTGTTLLYLPAAIVSAYYRRVPGAQNSQTYGGYVYSCGTTLPSITLGIGSYRAVVPGSYINYAPADNTGTTCFGGIQSNAGIGFSIYGDIFLKSQFVVFSGAATPQLGFAPKAT